ncbi:MAG TPA: hypothetical protein VF092_05490 [Longimicrobium sp.]
MRRIASLLFLLAFAFTQASAAECPMASASAAPASGDAHAMHGAAGHHGGHHADADDPGPRHSHAPGQRAECGIVMSCGAAVVVAGEIDVPAPSASADAPVRTPALYASPFIAIVSPPPRLALPA